MLLGIFFLTVKIAHLSLSFQLGLGTTKTINRSLAPSVLSEAVEGMLAAPEVDGDGKLPILLLRQRPRARLPHFHH